MYRLFHREPHTLVHSGCESSEYDAVSIKTRSLSNIYISTHRNWKVEAQGNKMEIRKVAAYIAYIKIFRIANVHCPIQIAQVRSELSLGARAL